VPYDVQLVAGSVAGCGEPVTSQPFFTREGGVCSYHVCMVHCATSFPNTLCAEPQRPPHNVTVERLNGTAMNVSWTRLSVVEAQSIAVAYIVRYSPQNGRKRQVREVMLPANQSYVVISGLDPVTIYRVEVFAINNIGQSMPVTAEITSEYCKCICVFLYSATKSILCFIADPDRLFQLRLSGIANCFQWVVSSFFSSVKNVLDTLFMLL